MNDLLKLKYDAFLVKRIFPDLFVYIKTPKGVLNKLILPKHLFFFKTDRLEMGLIFYYAKFENLKNIYFDAIGVPKTLIWEGYTAGEYTPHDINGEVLPIIKQYASRMHYSFHLLSELNDGELISEIFEEDADIFGIDFIQMVNIIAMQEISKAKFRDYLEHETADLIELYGEDLINFVKLMVRVSCIGDFQASLQISEMIEDFGLDMAELIARAAGQVNLRLIDHFSEDLLAHELLRR